MFTITITFKDGTTQVFSHSDFKTYKSNCIVSISPTHDIYFGIEVIRHIMVEAENE